MAARDTSDGCPVGWTEWPLNPENCINTPGGNGNVVRMKSAIKQIYQGGGTSDEILAHVAATLAAQREPPAQDLPATPAGAPAGTGPSIQPERTMQNPALLAQLNSPQNSLIGDIVGAALPIIGTAVGGPVGGAIGGIVGGAISGAGGAVGGGSYGGMGSSAPPTTQFTGGGAGACPSGYISTPVGCIATSPGAYAPGGAPATMPMPGQEVHGGGTPAAGSFGLPAYQPALLSTVRLRCPRGTILGTDNLCYAKGSLPRQYRKWRYSKPYVTRADYKAISRADRARKKLIRLTKKAGAFASMHKPKPSMSKSAAARALRK